MTELKLVGPWVTYSDPRILPAIYWPNWGDKVQIPLLQGEIPWRTEGMGEYALKAWNNLQAFLSERGMAVEIRDGVAYVSDPRFAPVDDVTRETCRLHRLCDQESLDAGTYRLTGGAWEVWIKSAVALSETEWHFGVPLVEAEFHGGPSGRHAVVGRLDVCVIETSRHGRRWAGKPFLPGMLRVVDMSRPRWRYSAKILSAKVVQHLPAWDAWLRAKAEGDAFIEARREEEERLAAIAEAEADDGLTSFAAQINHPEGF